MSASIDGILTTILNQASFLTPNTLLFSYESFPNLVNLKAEIRCDQNRFSSSPKLRNFLVINDLLSRHQPFDLSR